jgi:hypothetical protein
MGRHHRHRVAVGLALLSATIAARAQDPEPLFPFRKGILHGFIDRKGEVVIAPRYRLDRPDDIVNLFAGDRAPVRLEPLGLFGYIDRAGEVVIPARFARAERFAEGLAAVAVESRHPHRGYERKFGYIDRRGDFVVEPRFDSAGPFSEGRACVDVGGKVGYIDVEGKFVIEPRWDGWSDYCTFREGRAAAAKDGAWGFIDRSGELVIPPRFKSPSSFHSGLAAVQPLEGSDMEYVDLSGKRAFATRFALAWQFSEGLARVERRIDLEKLRTESDVRAAIERLRRTAFIDITGEIVFELEDHFWVEPFSEGRAKVKVRDRATGAETVGYIDRTGAFVIPPRFAAGTSFHGGLALVVECGRSGYIDTEGRAVWGLLPGRASGTTGVFPDPALLKATGVARALGYGGELELVDAPTSSECTAYGRAIWAKGIRAHDGAFPFLTIHLLEGDTFLTAEREETYEAVLSGTPGIGDSGIVSRIPIEGGPSGYFAVTGFGPGGSIYAVSIPTQDRRFEILVLAAVSSEGDEPTDPAVGEFLGRLGRNPADVLAALARAAHEVLFTGR